MDETATTSAPTVPSRTWLPYQYSPLPTLTTIRLVRLHPAENENDPLKFTFLLLDRAELTDMEASYDAISHIWGEPSFTHRLFHASSSGSIPVTARVHGILMQARSMGLLSGVWIDSVCLNQGDDAEKGDQIPLMGDIYHQARTVHIWPGYSAELPSAFAFLQVITLHRNQPSRLEAWIREFRASPAGRAAVDELLHMPWFSRRWIIQEASLSHNSVIHIGSGSVSWGWFIDSLVMLESLAPQLGMASSTSFKGVRVSKAIRPERRLLLDLLWEFHTTACSDPRDRIFALAGLSSDFGPGTVRNPLDYAAPWHETYIRAAESLIHQQNHLDVLRHVFAFGSLGDVRPEWPSWVPDWRRPKQCLEWDDMPLFNSESTKRAGTRARGPRTYNVRLYRQPQLKYTGLRIKAIGFSVKGLEKYQIIDPGTLSPQDEVYLAAVHLFSEIRAVTAVSSFVRQTQLGNGERWSHPRFMTDVCRIGLHKHRDNPFAGCFQDEIHLQGGDRSFKEKFVDFALLRSRLSPILRRFDQGGHEGSKGLPGETYAENAIFPTYLHQIYDPSKMVDEVKSRWPGEDTTFDAVVGALQSYAENFILQATREGPQYTRTEMFDTIKPPPEAKIPQLPLPRDFRNADGGGHVKKGRKLDPEQYYTPKTWEAWLKSCPMLDDLILAACLRYCNSPGWKDRFGGLLSSLRRSIHDSMGGNPLWEVWNWGEGKSRMCLLGPRDVQASDFIGLVDELMWDHMNLPESPDRIVDGAAPMLVLRPTRSLVDENKGKNGADETTWFCRIIGYCYTDTPICGRKAMKEMVKYNVMREVVII